MLSQEELRALLTDLESDCVERTIATKDTHKFSAAICAFANDFPNHKKSGYLIIGIHDDGRRAGLRVTDELLKDLASLRTNGSILPQPAMTVQKYELDGHELAVVEVFPALHPPVRYQGKIWIRTGPTSVVANETEERKLIEKRTATAKTFDARPCAEAALHSLQIDLFKWLYLPRAIDPDTLAQNNRSIEQQLASLRLYDLLYDCPTYAGVLAFGSNPTFFLPGAYLQYVRFQGTTLTSTIEAEKRFAGPFPDMLKHIEDFLTYVIIVEKPVKTNGMREVMVRNYPLWALRELAMNALMHRDYESNAPVYLYEFSDRIEILNPGGLYGDARPSNFPDVSDYRNPVLAEVIKTLGYVNKFNIGIRKAQEELAQNGNPPAEFDLQQLTRFGVTVFRSQVW